MTISGTLYDNTVTCTLTECAVTGTLYDNDVSSTYVQSLHTLKLW